MVLIVRQQQQPGGGSRTRITSEDALDHESLSQLFDANRAWADAMRADDPAFFERLTHQQSPELLWIGCSDSRVPANQILGLAPGEIFVQRNVGNQALHSDMNLMACLEYAVKALKVKSVIVCGHYGCGAVRAALQPPTSAPGSLVGCWIADIRGAARSAAQELGGLSEEDRVARLCEINVARQVLHVCTSPVVQAAWAEGSPLRVWGLIYDLRDGLLRRIAGPHSAGHEPNGAALLPAPPSPGHAAPLACSPTPKALPRAPGGPCRCAGNATAAP